MLYRVWQIKEHPICFQAVLANLNRHCRNVQGLVWFPTNSLHWWRGSEGEGEGQGVSPEFKLSLQTGNMHWKFVFQWENVGGLM